MILVCFQGKPFNIIVIQVCAPTSNAKKAEVEKFYEDLQDLLDLIPQKRCPFHYRGLECKNRKSRGIWSNEQVWSWSTKWSRAKANRVLSNKALDIAKTFLQQHKRHVLDSPWTSPDGQYWNQIDFVLCSQRWRNCIQSAKTRWGADCGSDHELLIVKFRRKLKKVGKTMTPFRYDLNQIPMTIQFSSVQLLSHVRLFATPWIAAPQASLSITNYRSSLRQTIQWKWQTDSRD